MSDKYCELPEGSGKKHEPQHWVVGGLPVRQSGCNHRSSQSHENLQSERLVVLINIDHRLYQNLVHQLSTRPSNIGLGKTISQVLTALHQPIHAFPTSFQLHSLINCFSACDSTHTIIHVLITNFHCFPSHPSLFGSARHPSFGCPIPSHATLLSHQSYYHVFRCLTDSNSLLIQFFFSPIAKSLCYQLVGTICTFAIINRFRHQSTSLNALPGTSRVHNKNLPIAGHIEDGRRLF